MEIKTHGLDLRIRVSPPGREDWMITTVEVKVPNFEGAFRSTIQSVEFSSLIDALKKLHAAIGTECAVSWGNMEENILLELNLAARGHIRGRYRLSSDNFSAGPTLEGHFDADQTYLEGWIRQAEQDLRHVS